MSWLTSGHLLRSIVFWLLFSHANALKPILSRNMRKLQSRKEQKSLTKRAASIDPELPKLYNPLIPYNDKLIPMQEMPSDYVYVPPDVGIEIYVGSIVAVLPIAWGAVEFWKRIKTQQDCLLCTGSGLVYATRSGGKLTRPRKCWSCGGFIPWLGWKMFFFSTFFDIGNGGALQRPSADYDEINAKIRSGELEAGGPTAITSDEERDDSQDS